MKRWTATIGEISESHEDPYVAITHALMAADRAKLVELEAQRAEIEELIRKEQERWPSTRTRSTSCSTP